MSESVIAKPNGQGAVDNYNHSVAQLQQRIPELKTKVSETQALIVAHEAQLKDLLSNPVVLHDVAASFKS